ncbi:MAG: MATE family efflux transporter [Clostridium sp.]
MPLFSGPIISLFSREPEVIALGSKTLFIAAATEIFFSFTVIAGGISRGSGDVRFSLLVSIIGMWGLRIGLVWLAIHPLALGVTGVWLAIAADCFIRMLLCIWRIKSRKWRK